MRTAGGCCIVEVMKLERIVDWLDRVLDVKSFSDVSNNGVQIAREGDDVTKVAFGVDAAPRTTW